MVRCHVLLPGGTVVTQKAGDWYSPRRESTFATAEHLKHDATACGQWTSGAAIQAFQKLGGKNPEKSNEEMLTGVMLAIHETWPCK
jgi:hypothetical protein